MCSESVSNTWCFFCHNQDSQTQESRGGNGYVWNTAGPLEGLLLSYLVIKVNEKSGKIINGPDPSGISYDHMTEMRTVIVKMISFYFCYEYVCFLSSYFLII